MERVRLPPQAPHFLKKFFMRSGDKTFPDLRAVVAGWPFPAQPEAVAAAGDVDWSEHFYDEGEALVCVSFSLNRLERGLAIAPAFLRESIRHEIAAQLSVFDTIGSLE